MFCPKCSQEIVTAGLRFCPKCGLPLAAVTQLVADDGIIKAAEPPTPGLKIFKRKEYRLSAQLIFFSIFSVPIAVAFGILVIDSAAPLLIPLLLFLAGIARLSYTFLFGKGFRVPDETNVPQLKYAPPTALNEYREYVSPVENFGRATTNELVSPPSVTERTTNLLKDDEI